MTRSIPLVFFGTDNFAATVLGGLVKQGYDVRAVVSAPPRQVNKDSVELSPTQTLARQHKIKPLTPAKLHAEAVKDLMAAGSEFAVLASYGKLLPESVLGIFKSVVNVHPSLLPQWRGPSPIEAAILGGQNQTGVSLMKLVLAMDAGPIYAQSLVAVPSNADQISLGGQLAEAGRDLLLDKLPSIISGALEPKPQDEAAATYSQLINKSNGELDWSRPAEELERQIRAYLGWPKSHARLLERDLIVTRAKVVKADLPPGQVNRDNGQLTVGCGQDTLRILRLTPPGKSEMDAADWLRGLKS